MTLDIIMLALACVGAFFVVSELARWIITCLDRGGK